VNAIHRALGLAATAALTVSSTFLVPAAPLHSAGLPVFDVTNYTQNLLQAARALDQINNQVRSLQNEASMLQNMAKNLQSLDFPQLQRITSAMRRIDALMSEAQRIDFSVDGLDQRVRTLFPGELQRALSGNDQLAQARARLDAASAAYRQSMRVQAQVAANVQEDAGLLGELAASSEGAVGALQVGQAANQLMALSVKQQFQLQNLMASEFREAAIERARKAQAEEDGRAATRRFLGLETPARN
jgi:P-type conjugative transfer protein TrbJ